LEGEHTPKSKFILDQYKNTFKTIIQSAPNNIKSKLVIIIELEENKLTLLKKKKKTTKITTPKNVI
jgi:hypothetical protein